MITEYISTFKAIFAHMYFVSFQVSGLSFHILGSKKSPSFSVLMVFHNAC